MRKEDGVWVSGWRLRTKMSRPLLGLMYSPPKGTQDTSHNSPTWWQKHSQHLPCGIQSVKIGLTCPQKRRNPKPWETAGPVSKTWHLEMRPIWSHMWTSRNVNSAPLYILKIIAETTIMNASFKKFRVIHIRYQGNVSRHICNRMVRPPVNIHTLSKEFLWLHLNW